MLVPDLLLAPVIREDNRCNVYLPPGEWFDFWSDQVLQGPLTLELVVPLDRVPIYVRAGAVLPMMQPANRIPAGVVDPLILHIYPAADGVEAENVLFEDDGETHITVRRIGNRLKLRWNTPLQRTVSFRVHPCGGGESAPDSPQFTGLDGSLELEVA